MAKKDLIHVAFVVDSIVEYNSAETTPQSE